MPALASRLPRPLRALAVAALASTLVVIATPASASTAPERPEQPVQLSAKPVDQVGQYFDLTLAPGQTRRLEIALGNHDRAPIAAHTYAADAYTIINGGFGADLRDQEPTGATTWLDYPSEVITLDPDRAKVRAFTVSVPQSTPAGEYISSLVLENDDPVKGQGGVALDQVVRQVVAVAVRVPGPLSTGLSIGSAAHTFTTDRSVVAVDVSNIGNARLTPTAQVVVHDGAGAVVSDATVVMDSFYAATDTKVEISLETALSPGAYTVDLTLDDDERDAHAQAQGLPLTVQAPTTTADPAPSVRTQVVDVLRAAPGNLPVWAILLVALGVVLTATGAILGRRHQRSTRRHAARGRRRTA